VEQQLRTQEQLQQLAAVAVTASAQQAQQAQQQQALAEEAVAAADGRAPFKLPVPPLGAATGLSPPNSQRKLLAHLSLSMRPADREVG
jgi:CheY-like chemotaxis protein